MAKKYWEAQKWPLIENFRRLKSPAAFSRKVEVTEDLIFCITFRILCTISASLNYDNLTQACALFCLDGDRLLQIDGLLQSFTRGNFESKHMLNGRVYSKTQS